MLSSLACQSPITTATRSQEELVFPVQPSLHIEPGDGGSKGKSDGQGQSSWSWRTNQAPQDTARLEWEGVGAHYLWQGCIFWPRVASAYPRAQEECGSPDKTYHPPTDS